MNARLTLPWLLGLLALACDEPPPASAPPASFGPFEAVDLGVPNAVVVPPAPIEFQFVRLHAPAPAGAHQVRIGPNDRVRTMGMAVDVRGAPSRATLAKLASACTDPAVTGALRPAGTLTSSMTTLELSCGGVAGLLGCDASETCAAPFHALREAVDAAWAEDLPRPARGVALSGEGAASAFVMDAKGNRRGATTLRSVPAGTAVVVCAASDACVRATAPERIEVDGDGAAPRLRCASCGLAASPASVMFGPIVVLGSLDRAIVERVVRAQEARILACFAKTDAETARVLGKLSMKWVVNGMGLVTQAQVAASTLASGTLDVCLAKEIRTWRFPKPKGGGIAIVTAMFTFRRGN